MEQSSQSDASDKAAMEATWKQKIEAREFEIWLSSRLVAALTGAAIFLVFAYTREVTYLGTHPLLISTGIGFVVGGLIGERIVFTGVGILLAYFFLPTGCG